MKPFKFPLLFLYVGVLLLSYCLKAQEPKLMLPIGHTSFVNSVKFSSDSKKIATTSQDGTAKVWDVETGNLLVDLRIGYADYSNFSPNGKMIATVGISTQIREVESGRLLFYIKGGLNIKTGDVNTLVFSPDEKKVVITCGAIANIWNIKTKTILFVLKGHTGYINSAEFSPDGKRIVTASDDGTANVWDISTGRVLMCLKHNIAIKFASFSHDGNLIVTASTDSMARIWDAHKGVLLRKFKGHLNTVTYAVFSPDDNRIITSSLDKTFKIWDVRTGQQLLTEKPDLYDFNSSFSSDGKKIISTSSDTFNVWDINTRALTAKFNFIGHTISVSSALFSPDGTKIVTVQHNVAKVWDFKTGSLLLNLKGHYDVINSAQFSLDGKKIATASNDRTVKIWRTENGKLLVTLYGHSDAIVSALFSADGKKIVTASYDKTAKIWDAVTGVPLINLKHTEPVKSARFTPDGKKIVTSSKDSSAKIWDGDTGILLANLKGHTGSVRSAVISPDGKKIITASLDGTAKIWSIETGKLLADLKGHNDWFTTDSSLRDSKKSKDAPNGTEEPIAVVVNTDGELLSDAKGHTHFVSSAVFSPDNKNALITSGNTAELWDAQAGEFVVNLTGYTRMNDAFFSKDGKTIFTNAQDDIAKIWDSRTGLLLADLKGHKGTVNSGCFTPDGRDILTTSDDNTEKIWDAATGKLKYTFFAVDSTDYLVTDQYGRYDGTEGARKLLYFTCGTEVIGLDQVKDQLWVPNLAERIIKGDSINAPKLADLHICGMIPKVEQKEQKVGYSFQITPQGGGLGETALFVNGIEAKRYKKEQLLRTAKGYELVVTPDELQNYLVSGQKNPVTVKAYTKTNDISSRGVTVNATMDTPAKTKPNLYAVMVGVSQYKDAALTLKYAAKDATDLEAAIGASARELLNVDGKEHVFTYNLTTNEKHDLFPEKNAIKSTLEEIGKKATANDILLIFFAGHGVTQGDKKQFYFLSADASSASASSDPASVGVSTAELTDWIQPSKIRAQKRILILDACNSGQAINELNKMPGAIARNNEQSEQIKAIDKLNERSGMLILAASASNQSAYEMGRFSQGLLTYALLKAIKEQPEILENNKYLNVSSWFGAADKTVNDLISQTGNRQQPQIGGIGNFYVGKVDDKVRAKVILDNEKPLFNTCILQNGDDAVMYDNLSINKLLDIRFNEISARGDNNGISYIPGSNSPDAITLSGKYIVKGDEITAKINVIQNGTIKYHMEVNGGKTKLYELVDKIVKQATEWSLPKK